MAPGLRSPYYVDVILAKKWSHRARVAEAMILLTAATTVRTLVPMPRWSRALGETSRLTDLNFDPTDIRTRQYPRSVGEHHVALAIRSASKRLPYDPRCLDQATAGQLMLRGRRHPGVIVIGLSTENGPGKRRNAHAWLVGSTGAITGGAAARDYVAASCFIPPEIARAT